MHSHTVEACPARGKVWSSIAQWRRKEEETRTITMHNNMAHDADPDLQVGKELACRLVNDAGGLGKADNLAARARHGMTWWVSGPARWGDELDGLSVSLSLRACGLVFKWVSWWVSTAVLHGIKAPRLQA